uniref:Uncharacterized protein n=1 Tax=Opuntia streptacantha TaxID=393608 RepID=A0A7C9AZT7_OPUST
MGVLDMGICCLLHSSWQSALFQLLPLHLNTAEAFLILFGLNHDILSYSLYFPVKILLQVLNAFPLANNQGRVKITNDLGHWLHILDNTRGRLRILEGMAHEIGQKDGVVKYSHETME